MKDQEEYPLGLDNARSKQLKGSRVLHSLLPKTPGGGHFIDSIPLIIKFVHKV